MPELPVTVPTSSSNSSGFTLIEVVVAMALVLVSLMGLLQVAGLATAANIKNQLRDEAVLVAEKQMADLMTKPQSAMNGTAGYVTFDVVSSASGIRGRSLKYYTTRQTAKANTAASDPSGQLNSYKLLVQVTWNYKTVPYTHEVEVMRTFSGGM